MMLKQFTYRRLATMVLACAMVLSVGDLVHADEIGDLRAENAALKKQLGELKKQLADMQQAVSKLTAANAALKSNLDTSKQKQDAIEKERSSLHAKLTEAKAEGDELVARRVKLYTNFDADSNRTTVSTEYYLLDLGGPLRSKQAFQLTYEYAGKEAPATPGNVALQITAQNTGGTYAHAKTGILEVDGKAFACKKLSYDSRRKRGVGKRSSVSYDEEFSLAVAPATMQAISAGRNVRLKIGRLDIPLEGDSLAAFTAIYRRVSK